MLLEQNGKAYIADKVEDGKVTQATEYVFNLETCRYARVGESVEINGKYKEIFAMNVRARYSVKSLEVLAESETIENAEHPNAEEETEPVESEQDESQEPELELEEEPEPISTGHTFEILKAMTKVQQCEIAKEMGLKGFHNVREDERINMILKG